MPPPPASLHANRPRRAGKARRLQPKKRTDGAGPIWRLAQKSISTVVLSAWALTQMAGPAAADSVSLTGSWSSPTKTQSPTIVSGLNTTFASYSSAFTWNYALYSFVVDTTGSYTATTSTTPVTNTTFFLEGLFSPSLTTPTTPISNFLYSNFVASGSAPYVRSFPSLAFTAGTTYSVLIAFNNSGTSSDSFTFDMSGPGCIAIDTKTCVVSPPPPQFEFLIPSPPPPPPPPPSNIDGSQASFGNNDRAVQGSQVTFDGGTLKTNEALSLTQNVTVNSGNGTIDPNGSTVTLSGAVDGTGALTIAGSGAVVLTGNVSNTGGIDVKQGALTVASGGAVSAAMTVENSGSLTVGGTATGPVTVTNGGSLTVASGGSVGGTVAVTGGTVTVAGNATVGGALTLSNSTATIDGRTNAPVTASAGSAVTVGSTGSIAGALSVTGASATIGGTASGAVTVANGGSVTVASGGVVNNAVSVTGGTVAVAGNAAITGPLAVHNGTVTVDAGGGTGSLTVDQGGTAKVNGLTVGTVAVASGSTLSGSGTVLGTATLSGILSPGNSPGTMTFRAPVVLTGTSVYRAEIDGTTAGTGAGHHDQVVVQGGSFTAAGTLTPVLRGITGSATNAFTATPGNSFTIVSADGGVTGSFAALTQPAEGLSAGTRFDTLYDPTAIRLVVTPNSYATLSRTANQRAVGAVVDAIRPAAGARLDTATAQGAVFSSLYGLSQGGVAGVLDQISGKVHADTLAAGLTNRRLFGQAVDGRLAALRGGGSVLAASPGTRVQFAYNGDAQAFSNADAGAGGAAGRGSGRSGATSLWGQPLVAYARTGSDGNAAGSTQRIGGFLVGADHAFEDGPNLGAALGFLRNAVSSQDGLGKGHADSYQATLYGSWDFGGPYVEGALGYGYGRYDATRSVAFGSIVQAMDGKANGHDLSAELAAGHRMSPGGGDVWIEPRVGLRFDRITRESFRESGSGLALGVDAAALTGIRSSIGMRTGTQMTLGEWRVEPTASLAWEHDFADVTPSSTNRLGGAAFTADASRRGRDAALIGVGLGVQLGDGVSAIAGFQEEIRSRELVHSATASIKWKL